MNKQIKKNIKDLDVMIAQLNTQLIEADEDEYSEIESKIQSLIKARCDLADSFNKGSVAPLMISGSFGLASVLVVLHYEKSEIITSKAFSMANRMFKGV